MIIEEDLTMNNENSNESTNTFKIQCLGIGLVLAVIAIIILIIIFATTVFGIKAVAVSGITLLVTGIILMEISGFLSNT